MDLRIPAHLSHSGISYVKTVDVDRCIWDLINKLNSAGIVTISSCCGHGRRPGSVILGNGQELLLIKDYEEGRKIDDILNKNGYNPIN